MLGELLNGKKYEVDAADYIEFIMGKLTNEIEKTTDEVRKNQLEDMRQQMEFKISEVEQNLNSLLEDTQTAKEVLNGETLQNVEVEEVVEEDVNTSQDTFAEETNPENVFENEPINEISVEDVQTPAVELPMIEEQPVENVMEETPASAETEKEEVEWWENYHNSMKKYDT